jgi:hypothetical protein
MLKWLQNVIRTDQTRRAKKTAGSMPEERGRNGKAQTELAGIYRERLMGAESEEMVEKGK